MLRMLKYPLLFLAVCSIALPARGAEKKQEKKKDEAKAVIAVFTFDKPIAEKPSGEHSLSSRRSTASLKDLVDRMKAKDDRKVKAVVLLLDEAERPLRSAREFRRAITGSSRRARSVRRY